MAKNTKVQVAEKITITAKQHDDLLKHVIARMELSKDLRDKQVIKFTKIDRMVAGYIVLDEDDRKRQKDNEKGYGVKPVDSVLPLTLTSLDEATTFLLEVIQNDGGLYSAIAPKEKQAVAKAFTGVMNENAVKFHHLNILSLFLFNSLKYNFSALIPSWFQVHGNKLTNNISQTAPVIESTIVYEGNMLECADVYNFFYDSSVEPTELAAEGEYFATVDTSTAFRLRKSEKEGKLFNLGTLDENSVCAFNYYESKPCIRADDNIGDTDFCALLSQTEVKDSVPGHEIITMFIWLDPSRFGLSNQRDFQIWKLKVLNAKSIVYAEHMNNAHGMLPVGISMPWYDGFVHNTKSYAELLQSFQTFASFQLNILTKSHRKALYGVTFYNKNVVDLDDEYDPVAGKVPVNAPPDADLNKAIRFFNDTPDTNANLNNITAMADFMQKVLPTDILRQVASLDRATQYQSAATVQGANRRNLKIARTIYDQALNTTNMMLMYNILQYQKSAELLTPTGELTEINPAEFRDTQLEFEMSEGLQGLDKLSMIMSIKEVLNTIVQSQHASAQIDVVEVINYWTSMLGDRTDFSQFRFKSEIDKLPPEQKDMAFQLLQQFMQEQQGGGADGAAQPASQAAMMPG